MFGISSKPVDTHTWDLNSLYCVLLTAGDNKSASKQTEMSLWNFLRPIHKFICFAKLVFSSSDVLSFCLSFSVRASVSCQETCREGWRRRKCWHIPTQSVKSSHLSVDLFFLDFVYLLFIYQWAGEVAILGSRSAYTVLVMLLWLSRPSFSFSVTQIN